MFKIVNQFEIEGINNQLRIPDGIVFINGIDVYKRQVQPLIKNISSYQRLKPVYDAFQRAKDKPSFKAKHEAELVIFEAARSKMCIRDRPMTVQCRKLPRESKDCKVNLLLHRNASPQY